MMMKNMFVAILFVAATALAGHGQINDSMTSVEKLRVVVNSSALSADQMADALVAIINDVPQGKTDVIVAYVVASLALQDAGNMPQVIAAMVNAVDTPTARKIVASVAILAPSIAQDAAVMTRLVTTEIQNTVQDSTKVKAVMAAAEKPSLAVDVDTVRRAGKAMVSSSDAAPAAPAITIPTIPNEIIGYGGQTEL